MKKQSTHRPWTEDEVRMLRAVYGEFSEDGALARLARKIHRHPANIARKARALGFRRLARIRQARLPLAGPEFGSAAHREHLAAKTREQFAMLGHPRGMLGKRHTQENLERARQGNRRYWAQLTAEQLEVRNSKMIATRIARRGAGNTTPAQLTYTRGRGGRRADLGDVYFRSSWEANYARYLNFLVTKGAVASWQYEPMTVIFPVDRGPVRTYTPDFAVIELPTGWLRYHEVKGVWSDRFFAQLDLIGEHRQDLEPLTIVDAAAYAELHRQYRHELPGWESA